MSHHLIFEQKTMANWNTGVTWGMNYHKIAKYLQEVSFAPKVGFLAFMGPIWANRVWAKSCVAKCSIHLKNQLYLKKSTARTCCPMSPRGSMCWFAMRNSP